MDLKKAAIGAGIGYVVFRNLRGLFIIIFLVILLCFFFSPDEPTEADQRAKIRRIKADQAGWDERILDVQKAAISREFPDATNEQKSEVLLLRAETERLKLVRDGKLDPDWRLQSRADLGP